MTARLYECRVCSRPIVYHDDDDLRDCALDQIATVGALLDSDPWAIWKMEWTDVDGPTLHRVLG